jgi:hypothetical protein
MKRLIAVVSFAVLAAPAFAAGLPYDQNVIDRTLPALQEKDASTGETRNPASDAARLPYDQNLIDRALPDIRK